MIFFALASVLTARFNRRSIKETKKALFHARSGNGPLSIDICETLKTVLKSFVYFTLAFAETTDIIDTFQLAVFIRGVSNEMRVTEEFLDIVSLKDRTKGKDEKEAVIK